MERVVQATVGQIRADLVEDQGLEESAVFLKIKQIHIFDSIVIFLYIRSFVSP